MKGSEFIKRLKKLGRQKNISVEYITRRGKGSHGMLYYGDKFTVIRNPKDELKKGTLHAMLEQLGLTLDDIQG